MLTTFLRFDRGRDNGRALSAGRVGEWWNGEPRGKRVSVGRREPLWESHHSRDDRVSVVFA